VSPVAGSRLIAAAALTRLLVSLDGGVTWYAAKLPAYSVPITGATVDGAGNIWMMTRAGTFMSADGGDTWRHESGPGGNFSAVSYDADGGRLLAIDRKGGVFQAQPNDLRWKRVGEAGWMLRALSASRGRLFAATAFDGVVAQSDTTEHRAAKNVATGNSQ
jgi:hypothetical protein